MFVNCPFCRGLVATDPATDLPPERCPRCAAPLRGAAPPGADDARSGVAAALAEAFGPGGTAVVEDPGVDPAARPVISIANLLQARPATTGETGVVGAKSIGAEGIGAEGIGAEGVGAEGVGAEGVGAEGVAAEGVEAKAARADVMATEARIGDAEAPEAESPEAEALEAEVPVALAPAGEVPEAPTPEPEVPSALTSEAATAEPLVARDNTASSAATEAKPVEPAPTPEHPTAPEPQPARPVPVPRTTGRPAPSFARRGQAAAAASAPARRRWMIPAASAGLALLLGLQWLLADRARLAADAGWRPVVAQACAVFGCNLPPWHEPAAFALLERDVRPHPDAADALRITASFRNEAAWAQRWPEVVLTLLDIDGRPLGTRAFTAAEYLGGDPPSALVDSGQGGVIRLDVREPGPGAVGFSFDFR